nr:PAS domain S-box protein [Gammaproteobacteria bacterium]
MRRLTVIALWLLLASGVLAADLLLPLGAAMGVPYVLLALIGGGIDAPWFPFARAALITLFIGIGWYASPVVATNDPAMLAANRLLAVLAVWIAAIWAARRLSAEQAEDRATDLLQTVAEATSDMVFAKDRSGKLVLANPAVCRALGKPAERLLGHDEAEWIEEAGEAVLIRGNDRRIMEGGRTEVVEEWVTIPDGKRLFRVTKMGLRSKAGRVMGLVGVGKDVTAERQADEANQWLAAIIKSTNDAIIGKTLGGIVTSWNGGAERLYGYTADEVIGQTIARLVPPDRPDEVPGILARLGRGEFVDHFETVRVCKDGSLRDVSLNISPIKDTQGQIIGASAIARDITERKETEKKLREFDRRKDEFLAMLGHELRNPLASLANAVEILRMVQDPETVEKSRAIMQRQLAQLTRLVDDLLDVSRISQGKLHLQRSRIELAAVVRSALEDIQELVEQRGHKLSVTFPEVPIFLEADPIRLSQVLTNLLTNAAKYTPPGGHIELLVEWREAGARVSVRDNGLGIPPDKLDSAFEMFGQLDRTLETTYKGLGVGLSLVKSLVELHGGTIEAHSDGLGKGSAFRVWLPIASTIEASQQGTQSGAVAAPPLATRRVLLVDDNPDVAHSLARLMEMLGHETRIAFDGLEAVEVAAVFQPHLVLLDIGLPKLDGYDAARRIRAQPWGEQMVLAAVTGWGQEVDRQRAKVAGFDHHLTKPVKIEALQALLDGVRTQ